MFYLSNKNPKINSILKNIVYILYFKMLLIKMFLFILTFRAYVWGFCFQLVFLGMTVP